MAKATPFWCCLAWRQTGQSSHILAITLSASVTLFVMTIDFADAERLSEFLTNPVISPVSGIEYERLDLQDVGNSVSPEDFTVSLYIDYFADELGMQAQLVDMKQSALEDHRKLFRKGSIYQFAPDGCQSRSSEFIDIPA